MARVFVTRRLPGTALDRLAAEHEVDVWPEPLPPPPDALRHRLEDADALLALLTDPIDADLIASAPRLRAIANFAVGHENIDVDAATAREIQVGNTPGVLTDATADLALALILALARDLPHAADRARDGSWRTWEPAAHLGLELRTATLGIVGLGRIGRAVQMRAQAFGMTVIHSGRDGTPIPLDDLLERADVVSLHCPLTPNTRHLIDAPAFARMGPRAFLVNTARGPIVDQPALVRALAEGEIAGAALDVTDPEPPPGGDPLLQAPNLLLVPHIASATETTRARMADLAVDNLLAALDGRPMPHPVNDP